MKKLLIIIPVLITLMLCIPQLSRLHSTEKPVNKSINLSIYSNNNYSLAAYDNTIASVRITVYKVVDKKYTPVYEKTLGSMQLKQFPDVQNAMSSSVTL